MKGSLLIEVHGWRGLNTDKDLFSYECRLGFVTFYISRELVSDRLADMKAKLENLRRLFEAGGPK